MISEKDDVLDGGEDSFINRNFNYEEFAWRRIQLREAKQLLKEAVEFMNKVPNNKYGNHYELCSRIDKFLKETSSEEK